MSWPRPAPAVPPAPPGHAPVDQCRIAGQARLRTDPQALGHAGTEAIEEVDNLWAALDWCHEHEPGWELRMALTLFVFWLSRGFAAEGRRRLAGILAKFPDPTLDRALALSANGRRASRQNDFEAAEASLQEALVIQRRAGQPERGGACAARAGLGAHFRAAIRRGRGVAFIRPLRREGDRGEQAGSPQLA